MAEPTPITAGGSAGTQQGVSADVQGPQVPAADSKSSDPDKETWQILPFGEVQYNLYDAGKGSDGLFSSGFGKIGDLSLASINAGFTTNVNADDVRFEFGPELDFGFLRGGPQTNESKITYLGIGPRAVLDWNRVWGFSHLRLLGRLDAAYNIGYFWGESTANPSIRKYGVDGLNHLLRGGLEVIGWNFSGGEAGLKANLGTHIADADPFNITGVFVGGGLEMRLGTHGGEKCTDVRHLHRNIKETEDRIAKLRAENKTLVDQLKIIRDYIEAQPKHPHVGPDLNRGRILGHVVDSLIAKLGKPLTEENLNKIQTAVKEANKAKKDEEMPAAVAKATGIPEAEVSGYFAVAKTKVDADPDFWKLTEDVPVGADTAAKGTPGSQENCVSGTYRDKLDERLIQLMKIADQLSDRNAELKGQFRRAVYLAGLSLGVEEIKDPTVIVDFLPVQGSKFRIARPTVDDVAKLKALVASRGGKPVEANDPELLAIIKRRQPGARGATIYTPAATDKTLKDIMGLADYMTGKTDALPSSEMRKVLLKAAGVQDDQLNPDDEKALEAARRALQGKKIIIVGRTDSQGAVQMNMELSQRRAEWDKGIMMSRGMSGDRIEAIGIGPTVQIIPEKGLGGEELLEARFYNRGVDYLMDKRKPKQVGVEVGEADQKAEKGSDAEARKEAGLPEEKKEKPAAKPPAKPAAKPAAGAPADPFSDH